MKQLLYMCIPLLVSTCIYAQTDTIAVTAADSLAPAKSTFTVGVVYANDANYYGQKAATANPYIAAAAAWRHKSGLYFTGQAYRLLKDSSGIASAGSLGIGWDVKLSPKWTMDLSYSHTFFAQYSPFLQSANTNNLSATLTRKGWIDMSAGADYAFGKSNDAFVTLAISKDINLGSITNKDIVSLTPAFSVVGGTQRYYETYITEKRVRDSLLGNVLNPIFGTPSQTEEETKTVSSTSFNLLSYNLKLPVSYARARYLLELAYQLSVLSSKAQMDPGKSNSFFTISFYYQF